MAKTVKRKKRLVPEALHEDAVDPEVIPEPPAEPAPEETPSPAVPEEAPAEPVEAKQTADRTAGAPAARPTKLDEASKQLKNQLSTIRSYGMVTVQQFVQYSGIGENNMPHGKVVLDLLVSDGLVERTWSESQGRYLLTGRGKDRLSSLS